MKKQVKRRKELPAVQHEKFLGILCDIRKNSRFDESVNYIQHGKTSVREHSINVAYTAYYLTHKLNIKVKENDLIRGALLHDYFLYDWHDKSLKNSIHGYTHPGNALKEALKDFELSKTEQDMIKHHMFPLTITPPKTKEGVILCIADKLCAIKETVNRR